MDIVVNSESNSDQTASDSGPTLPTSGQVVEPTPSTPVDSPPPSPQPEPPTPTDTASNAVPAPPAATPPKPKGGSKKWLVVIILLLLVAAGAAGAYLILHKSKKPAQQATVTKNEIPVIVYGTTSDGPTGTFYPYNLPNTEGNTPFDENQQIFEGLVQFTNAKQISPQLATGWTNPDDTTWIFTLAKNIKFHNGHIMTAKDVVFSLNNFRTTDTGKAFAITLDKVEAVDDYKVKITTKGPDPLLLNRLAFLYIIDSKGDKPGSTANGTGPYTLKPGTKPSVTEDQLVAFDNWHGGRPLTRAVTYKVYADEDTMIAALKKGEINIAGDLFDQKNIDAVPTGHTDLKFQDIGQSVLEMNVNKKNSPVANKLVRQALYAAIDPAGVLKARGVQGVVVNQIVPQDVPGYNPTIPTHVRDTAKAKALLKQAGYPNGVTIPYTVCTCNGKSVVNEIIKEAGEGGITLKAIAYDIDQINTDVLAGKFDLWGYAWNTQLLDASDVFTSAFQGKVYTNPAIDAQIATANKTLDAAKRLGILQNISKDLMDDVAWIPLYSRLEHWVVPTNYVIQRDWPGEAFGVNFASVYSK